MRVTHYKDPDTGELFREIIDKKYTTLYEFKKAYEAKGKRAWLNLWDVEGKWKLTVNMGKEDKKL